MIICENNQLVLGSSSQLARYFPNNFVKLSSRNIKIDDLKKKQWDTIYVCFAEQRTYLANSSRKETYDSFWEINYNLVLSVINGLQDYTRKIVYYSTAELWNNCVGEISLSTPFCFHSNLYTDSKYEITSRLSDKKNYPKVSIVYPFNFNSIYRNNQYLFGKVISSIVEDKKIEIGDTNFYRELLHASMVVEDSIKHDKVGEDFIVGSGRVTHIEDFIRRLYEYFGKSFESMVERKEHPCSFYRKNIFYSSIYNPLYSEKNVFQILVNEISNKKGLCNEK